MNADRHQEMVETLTNIWTLWINYPELRLGQMLSTFDIFNEDATMFYQKDSVTNKKLKEAWDEFVNEDY